MPLLNPEIDYTPTPYDSWQQLTKDYYDACRNSNDPISYEQGSALDAIVVEALAGGGGGGGSVDWGGIGGTLSAQADLVAALALKAPLASPTFTGVPAAPTATPGTNTTQLATTAFVTAQGALKANIASPTFTGTPAAPTPTVGDNTTKLATTAFVQAAVAGGTAGVASFNGRTGIVLPASGDYVKGDVGLGNVDNTSDANKPVSTAQATALALKAPLASPTFTGTVAGITAAMVGLSNVDNTSDASKPVSTAQAAAIALKQDADADLTAIAGLSASNDDILQRKAGAWANRTIAQLKTDLSLAGTNSGDQTITLSGDVTGSGTAGVAATIAADAVTYAKMQNVSAASKLIGRGDSGSGDPQEITLGSGLSMTGTTLSASGGGGGLSGLTANKVPKATSSTTISDSRITDDGTNFLFGTTASSSASPCQRVSFGGQYGVSAPGSANNLKWVLYDDGTTPTYGIGMSAFLMEIQSGGDIGFFVSGQRNMTITSGGSVGIGISSTDASALMDLTSSSKGFLPPRMTTTQKNAISSPAAGLCVYDTTTNKLCCYNGTTWNDCF